jgi:hypothetical protein
MARQGVPAGTMAIPLFLRRVPISRRALAELITGYTARANEDSWWELVDAAASDDDPPVGVALSQLDPWGCVHILALKLDGRTDPRLLEDLLTALIAALRLTEARSAAIFGTGAVPVLVLERNGFGLIDGDGSVESYEMLL